MKKKGGTIIWIMGWMMAANASAAAYDAEKLTENIQNSVAVEQTCRIDEEVTFTLKKGESARLSIPDDPYEFAEFYLYWGDVKGAGELIYTAAYDTQHNQLTLAGSKSQRGALRQIGRLPYLAIAEWTKDNQRLRVTLCISSDKQKNTDAVNRAAALRRAGKESFSALTRNWNALAAPATTETERIAGFVRLWSEAKYNFAFFDRRPDLDWDQVLIDYLPRVQNAEDTFEYYRILKQCVALLRDGHTSVDGPCLEPLCSLPLKIRPVQGKALITGIVPDQRLGSEENRAALQRANLRPGDEITQMDGRPLRDILERDFYPYIAASTPQRLDLKAFPDLLKGPPQSRVALRIRKPDGTELDVSLVRKNYTFNEPPNPFTVRQMDGGILYINLDGFGSERIVKDFESALPQILEARGLLLDVRQNGGGSSDYGTDIIGYLIDTPIENTLWKTPRHTAAYKAWGREDDPWLYGDRRTVAPRPGKTFAGPVVVLTSAQTYSAAEDFTVVLHAAKRALIVGERTGGSTGQPLRIKNLPGGGSARICTKHDSYPDGREYVGVGVIPDVEVFPLPEDLAAGKDTVLQEGIEQLKLLIGQESGL